MKQASSFLNLGLHPTLSTRLARMGVSTPTHIQWAALPSLLSTNHHHFIAAQTGTGKTLTYLLPYLQKYLSAPNTPKPKALLVTASRELVLQLSHVLTPFDSEFGIETAALYSTQPCPPTAHIVSATIDRVMGLRAAREVSLASISELVIDECDTLVDCGRVPHIETLIAEGIKVPGLRISLVSATFPRSLEAVIESHFTTHPATAKYQPYMKRVVEERAHLNLEHLKHDFVELRDTGKDALFQRLLVDVTRELKKKKACMVFCNSIATVEKVARQMHNQKYAVLKIHSDMTPEDRVQAYNAFRKGESRFLVCTDVCSRGLDFPSVSHVVQYDFPRSTSDYLHRAGRAGRCFQEGTVITMYRPENARVVRQLQASFETRTQLRLSSPALSMEIKREATKQKKEMKPE